MYLSNVIRQELQPLLLLRLLHISLLCTLTLYSCALRWPQVTMNSRDEEHSPGGYERIHQTLHHNHDEQCWSRA